MFQEFLQDFSAGKVQALVPAIVIALVLLGGMAFVWRYWLPAGRLLKQLKAINAKLVALKDVEQSQRKKRVAKVFEATPLEPLWKEYARSLHDQRAEQNGETQLVKSRATVSAEAIFSPHAVVDGRIGAEFFKHLPGILTGIGIIGTFFGLILGLQGFDLSGLGSVAGGNAEKAAETITDSVGQLLRDVMYAFCGSLASIVVAMAVTFFEKKRLNTCYLQLALLVERIDALFHSGVTEEYLEKLARSSSESAVQMRHLKDSLVTDLRAMLQNLVDTQVRESLRLAETLSGAYRDSGQQLAEQVSGAIVNGLEAPLNTIASVVQQASGEQSNQVQGLLTEVLAAFMSKLESTFGQQFSGMSQMMGQSVGAMQSMQQGFNELLMKLESAGQASADHNARATSQMLADMQASQNAMQASMNEMLSSLQHAVEDMGKTGQGGAERMAQQLEALFAQSELRQQAMAENLQSFVAAVQSSVGKGQQEILDRLGSAVDRLSEQLEHMFAQTGALQKQAQEDAQQSSRAIQASTQATMGGLSTQLQQIFEQTGALQKQAQQEALQSAATLQNGTQTAVAGLEQQVQVLLQAVMTQSDAVQQRAQQLGAQTAQNIQQMQLGADKMRQAADRFDGAGESVSRAGQSTVTAMGALQSTGTALVTAGQELTAVLNDYRNHRDAVGKTLTVLQSVVAGAQSESTQRQKYLLDLQNHADQLQGINREAEAYLEQVSQVLGRGFGEFSDGVQQSLSKTLGSLDAELGKAITQLGGGVETVRESLEELQDAFDTAARRR